MTFLQRIGSARFSISFVMALCGGCGEPAVEQTLAAYDQFLEDQWECHRERHPDPVSEEEYWSMDWNLAPGTPWRECMKSYGHKKEYRDHEYFDCVTEFLETRLLNGACGLTLIDLQVSTCTAGKFEGQLPEEIANCVAETLGGE